MYALLRADDPLAAGEAVSLSALATRPLLLPTQQDAAGLREHLLGAFRTHGLTPRLSPPIHGYELAIASVASGRGYTLCVPSVARVDDDLVFRPIADAVAPIRAVLLTARADLGPATRELIRVARAMARDAAMVNPDLETTRSASRRPEL